MATPPKPHADTDNALLATAMSTNQEIRRLISKLNDGLPIHMKPTLLEIALATATQAEALHEMNVIRQHNSRRIKRA